MPPTNSSTKVFDNSGTYTYTKVGHRVLVWSNQGPEGSENRRCIISSHACQKFINAGFRLPEGLTVGFYCEQGTSLKGSLYRAMRDEYDIVESFSDHQKCPNYSLGKFQGIHSGRGNGEKYAAIAEQYHHGDGDVQFDIVTIRNRPGRMATTLKNVIYELRKNGYLYHEIHCMFCRVPLFRDRGITTDIDRQQTSVS